jgi:hypothetical protein
MTRGPEKTLRRLREERVEQDLVKFAKNSFVALGGRKVSSRRDRSLIALWILHIDITRLTVGVRVFGLGVF